MGTLIYNSKYGRKNKSYAPLEVGGNVHPITTKKAPRIEALLVQKENALEVAGADRLAAVLLGTLGSLLEGVLEVLASSIREIAGRHHVGSLEELLYFGSNDVAHEIGGKK